MCYGDDGYPTGITQSRKSGQHKAQREFKRQVIDFSADDLAAVDPGPMPRYYFMDQTVRPGHKCGVAAS